MTASLFSSLFLTALTLSYLIQMWLNQRHKRHVAAHRDHVPNAFQAKIDLAEHQKAADYTLSKAKFGAIELTYSSALLIIWTVGGGLNWIDQAWNTLQWDSIATGIAVIISAVLIMSLLDLPANLYHTFVIEQKFGFNKTDIKTFINDLLKNALISSIIGIPLIFVVLWLMESSGPLWWVYVWVVWIGFTSLLMWLYPILIAPLFNTFTRLEDSQLVEQINNLLQRCGFTSNGLFVMDGSRRSGHGNAYFTGLGAQKRIVFFDTLLKSLDNNEVEAVLAHELGHFKYKHVVKRLISMSLISLLSLAFLGWIMQQQWFYQAMQIENPSTHIALFLFLLIMPVFSFFVKPISSMIMRKHEYQADDFAAKNSNANDLISALVKLYSENATTLTPDPLYSAFYDSHPPAPVRVAYLSSMLTDSKRT